MNSIHHYPQLPQTNSHPSTSILPSGATRLTIPKAALRHSRIFVLSALIIYFLFPTQLLAIIASHPAFTSISDAGRRVFETLLFTPDPSTVSIVAACKNRHASLHQALPTWLASQSVREIILVDWNSDPPLYDMLDLPNRSKVKLVRVRNEPSWVLSRAYNLAINLSTSPVILRVDCDYALAPNILHVHNVSELDKVFYTGNWLLARDHDEVHLNGILLISRSHFLSVGGYDERIQTYGWDDDDLYTRLQNANLTKLNISYDHVHHVRHNDSVRTQEGVKFAQVQIDVNRLILEKIPPWSSLMYSSNASRYHTLHQQKDAPYPQYPEFEATYVPQPLRVLIPPSDYDDVWMLALGRRLADDHGVPWDVMATMHHVTRERLLNQLFDMQFQLATKPISVNDEMASRKPRIIIIHCLGPLQNRLSVLISALHFAQNTSRVPVVVWEPDSQLNLPFTDLFDARNLVILDEFRPKWPFGNIAEFDSAWRNFEFFNLIEGEVGGNATSYVVDVEGKQLYVRSDRALVKSTPSLLEADTFKVGTVLPRKDIHCCLIDLQRQGLKSAVGVHVRAQPLKEKVGEQVTIRDDKGVSTTVQPCIQEMTQILKERNDTMFFVAAESPQVRSYLESKFKQNILLPTRPECARKRGTKRELLDLLALRRCYRLLTSSNSNSFISFNMFESAIDTDTLDEVGLCAF